MNSDFEEALATQSHQHATLPTPPTHLVLEVSALAAREQLADEREVGAELAQRLRALIDQGKPGLLHPRAFVVHKQGVW